MEGVSSPPCCAPLRALAWGYDCVALRAVSLRDGILFSDNDGLWRTILLSFIFLFFRKDFSTVFSSNRLLSNVLSSPLVSRLSSHVPPHEKAIQITFHPHGPAAQRLRHDAVLTRDARRETCIKTLDAWTKRPN